MPKSEKDGETLPVSTDGVEGKPLPPLTFIAIGSIHMKRGAVSIPNRVAKVDALPVFFFSKGDVPLHPVSCLHFESDQIEKGRMNWQKSLDSTMAIVKAVADPGSLILDPCVGSGTTGEAALRLKCEFLGIEKDKENAAITREWLQKVERTLAAAEAKRTTGKTTAVKAKTARPKGREANSPAK